MPGQIARRNEALVAGRAHVIPLVRVYLFVRLKVPQGGELFAADLTLVRPFARVRAQVDGKVVLLGEPAGTEIACVRFFARVCAVGRKEKMRNVSIKMIVCFRSFYPYRRCICS